MIGRSATHATPWAIAALTLGGVLTAILGDGYTPFVLALVAMTTIVGVGLNILVGLSGQFSIGHIGFYAIGAYVVGVLTLKGVSFWLALPAAGIVAGFVGTLLALPAIRVSGPYLAMMTIAFAFIVEHGTIEWRELTGGQNGLMGIVQPSFGPGLGRALEGERGLSVISVAARGPFALPLPPPGARVPGARPCSRCATARQPRAPSGSIPSSSRPSPSASRRCSRASPAACSRP